MPLKQLMGGAGMNNLASRFMRRIRQSFIYASSFSAAISAKPLTAEVRSAPFEANSPHNVKNSFITSSYATSKFLAGSFRCPAGTAPIYSVILVHGAGNGMLCALARSDATREFEVRKQRALLECAAGGAGNSFLEASLPESSSCECKHYTPDCSVAISQEFLCCGPVAQR